MQQIFRLGKNEVQMFNGDTIVMGNLCFSRLRRAFVQYIAGNVLSRPDMKMDERKKVSG